MALLRTMLGIFLTTLCASLAASAQQHHLAAPEAVPHSGEVAFTPELRKFIDDLRENGTIPGLSVAVVRPEGKIELEGFGKSTEDGDKLVPEASLLIFCEWRYIDVADYIDIIQPRIMLEGICDGFGWHSYRRLRTGTERHASTLGSEDM